MYPDARLVVAPSSSCQGGPHYVTKYPYYFAFAHIEDRASGGPKRQGATLYLRLLEKQVTESLPSIYPGTQKRRSTRIDQAVPITVSGVDALGQPFKERTTTVSINCHGCKYQSKHYVPKSSVVTLEIPRMEPAFPPRAVQGHVVWVQRPKTVRELFQIGLEIDTPGNIWEIAFPPDDWFPYRDEGKAGAEAPSRTETGASHETRASAASGTTAPRPAAAVPSNASPRIPEPSPATNATPAAAGEAKIHLVAAPSPDVHANTAAQTAPAFAESKEDLDKTLRESARSAINAEMAVLLQQIDARIHENVERAIKASIERISETEVKKLVHQVANKAAAIVEEARATSEAQIAQIDTKVREAVQQATKAAVQQAEQRTATMAATAAEELRKSTGLQLQLAEERTRDAVQEAVRHATTLTERARQAAETDFRAAEENIRTAAEDAARMAANRAIQQTVSQDLRNKVEEVLERVIAEREGKVPSLQVLASPEAAQARLEEWKTSLESAAHDIHQRTIGQLQGEEQRVMRESQERFDAGARDSSAELTGKLSELSQAMLANTSKEIADRTAALNMLLNQMISQSESSIHSLGLQLVQQRTSVEQAKASLEEAAKSAVEGSQQQIAGLMAEQQQSIGQRVDALIGDRVRSVDPLLKDAAQNVMERFSGEMEHKVAAKVEEAHRTISEITGAAARASDAHALLDRQVQDATAQADQLRSSLELLAQQAAETSLQKALAEIAAAQQEAARLHGEFRQQAQELAGEAARNKAAALESIQQGAARSVQTALEEVAQASRQANELQADVRSQMEQASAHAAAIHNTAREKVRQESDAAVEKAVAELAFAGQELVHLQDSVRVQKEAVADLVEEGRQLIRTKIQEATAATLQASLAELNDTLAHAGQLQNDLREQGLRIEAEFADVSQQTREQVRAASDRESQESLDRLRQDTSKLSGEMETACRATVARMEEELDQKSSELQHSAYEALLKTSEWYQKKAQLTMQSTMERVLEQSSNSMKEKAAEISNMVAAELDHYRRSYIEHGQLELAEAAKETLARERQRLAEAAEIAAATFTDRAQRILHEAFGRFEESSREAIEQTHSQMKNHEQEMLRDFQKTIDEKMTQGVEHAAIYLQSQMVPLLESWEEKRQVEQQEWMENLKESAEESIASYKARLENTTNAWLLGSAATLGQNSQAVLDSLAKAAEKQLRETCSRVLVGMADVFKDRLIGISSAFTSPDSLPGEENPSKG